MERRSVAELRKLKLSVLFERGLGEVSFALKSDSIKYDIIAE